jgi:alginate O-acetyltransferase complex protein AlgI
MGKKVIIANEMGKIADTVWGTQDLNISVAAAWTAMIAYTLQIYFDFSGYSDMAIGLGRMMGFHFAENFNYPYISGSVSEFWRRWHISLGSWFRDYVYFPLGGSYTSKGKMIRNLLIVWSITGFWHGAEWTFLLWGFYYGVLICIEKVCGFEERKD